MAKIEFSDILEKTKETASSVGSKISKTATQIKETAKDKYEDIKEKSSARKNDKHDTEDNVRIKLDDALRLSVTHYNDAFTIMNDNGDALCDMRTRAVDLILNVETLVNSIANRPKSFDTDIVEIQSHRMSFTDACEFAKAELDAAKKSALGAGAGIATGAAIVSVAPAAAMWVATTFGTASTGTAIREQLICPFKNVLISFFCTDVCGISFSVGKAVGARLTVFREPEAQSVCSCLSCFVSSKPSRGIAGVAIHHNCLYACKRIAVEH